MFAFFSKMKLKHKLLLICILPFCVQMFFIGEILWQNYEVLQRKDKDEQLTYVFEDAGKLFKPLNIELDLSFTKLKGASDFRQEDLLEARRSTDRMVTELQSSLQESSVYNEEEGLSARFQEISTTLDKIPGLREQVDAGAIQPEALVKEFSILKETITDELGEIAKNLSDLEIARSMFAFINLIFEKMAIADERRLILDSLIEGSFSEADQRQLSNIAGRQIAYRKTFLELGSDKQDALYKQSLQNSSIVQSNRIINQLMNLEEGSELGIEPQEWWALEYNKITTMEALQDVLIEDMRSVIQEKRRKNLNELLMIIGSIAVVVPLAIYLLFYSLKKIVRKLQEEIVILSKSGNDIKSSITEATAGTAETATSVTETTTTVEELKQTAQVAAEKAKNVADVSKEATEILNTGEKTLEKTIDGMMRIQNGMSTISDSIVKLSEHSQSIGKIIDTVNELAEQSHLLAVNAAIEAAKAGEQGKGFSIVAQEVRTLAEQSKQATVQVRGILNDIQNSTSAAVMATEQGTKAVNHGVELSNEISDAMQTLSEGILKVTDATSQIELSSEQQLVGVNQVNVAMGNIREATEKHLEHMHQIEQSIEGMNTVGKALKDLVTKL